MPTEDPIVSAGTDTPHAHVNDKTVAVLHMIASGHSYEQILRNYPRFTYRDIFAAAQDALDQLLQRPGKQTPQEKARQRHARAYERWTEQEERRLEQMIADRLSVAQIAGRLQRQRSAVRSRIVHLGLVALLTKKEQQRFWRIVNRTERRPGRQSPATPDDRSASTAGARQRGGGNEA